MKVKCMLCGRDYNAIPWTHLRHVHNITAYDYHRMFPEAKTYSEERNQKISDSTTKYFTEHPETKQQMSRAITKYYTNHTMSREAVQLIVRANLGKRHTKETKQLISKALKELWKNSGYAQRVSSSRHQRPNETELHLQSILDKHFPNDWKYTGDGTFWIGGRNPDFTNVNGKKQVIEMFGYHWHDPIYFPNRPTEEELVAHYKKYGFDCLVFWEFDIWCDESDTAKRIKDFMKS